MVNRVLFFVYVLYCLEVGVFLIIYPWVSLWDQHSLLSLYPGLRTIVLNPYFRGAVSGLGVSNLLLGAWEVVHFQRYFGRA